MLPGSLAALEIAQLPISPQYRAGAWHANPHAWTADGDWGLESSSCFREQKHQHCFRV